MQFPARTELMRLLTFSTQQNLSPRAGLRQGQKIVDLTAQGFPARMKDLLAERSALERVRELGKVWKQNPSKFPSLEEKDITYLPPIPDADKFLCVGKNYRAHLDELRANDLLTETPEEPTAFVKLNSCLVGPRSDGGAARGHRAPRLRARAGVRHRQARARREEGATRSTTSPASPS